MSKIILILLILITCLGGFLRFYKNTVNPPSLNIDEVAYGYSAYSVLKTGRDEYDVFMPLIFRSSGDYKNSVLIYSLVPSIALFGLNEFSVRLTTALAGTLSIPVFFLLLSALFKNSRIALFGAAIMAVSPWHIYYSRYASDQLMGAFILMIGVWFFQKMIENGRVWIFPSAFFLALSMYTYHSERFFVPLFIASLLILNLKKVKQNKLDVLLFLLISLLMLLPLIYLSLFGPANKRAGMIFLSLDIDYTRYVILDHLQKTGESFLLFFFWIKRYLNYFQPDFLFFNGLNMTRMGTLGLGVLYIFELPFLLFGVIELIRNKVQNRFVIILWVLLGLIPASLTNNEQNTGRTLLIVPALLAIIALGFSRFLSFVGSFRKRCYKILFSTAYVLICIVFLIQAFLVFAVHFPEQKGEAFMEGTKEAVEYALLHKDQYKEIVFDPYRGIEAPYIVGLPYMYFLFYSQYDPALYQKEIKRYGEELFGWDKFTIRKIDWQEDRLAKDTLFIGSPWSLPEQDLKSADILKRIHLSAGDLVLLVVSPKQ